MSKQSEAKKEQGYNPKPVPACCKYCCHYQSNNVEHKSTWFGDKPWFKEENIRCGLGGFAVKKTATCNAFEIIL